MGLTRLVGLLWPSGLEWLVELERLPGLTELERLWGLGLVELSGLVELEWLSGLGGWGVGQLPATSLRRATAAAALRSA
jgi:hypothetical protein